MGELVVVVVVLGKLTLVTLNSDEFSTLSSLIVLFDSNSSVVLISRLRLPKEGSDLPDPDWQYAG